MTQYDFLFVWVDPLPFKTIEPPLGLLYIATLLEKRKYKCLVLDSKYFNSESELTSRILKEKPLAVGFSVISDNKYHVIRITNKLKREDPNIKIILGGPYATFEDIILLKESRGDIVVRGDGEYTMLKIAQSLYEGTLKHSINGITYNYNGIPKQNGPPQYINDLDSLPFPNYKLLENYQSYRPIIITSRGCPFSCTFCCEGQNSRLSYRSIENVINEVISLKRLYPNMYLGVFDDTFLLNKKRVLTFCDNIIEKIDLKNFAWFCLGHVASLSNNTDILKKLKDSGLVRLQLGIESGNKKILSLYNKKYTKGQLIKVIKECVRYDIPSIFGSFIIGGPNETKITIEDSIKLAKQLIEIAPGRFECGCAFLTPFPGTTIYSNINKFGLKMVDIELLTSVSLNYPFCETFELNKWNLIDLRNDFQKQIHEKMNNELSKVSKDCIEAHYFLSNKYGLKTDWYKIYETIPSIVTYFKIIKDGYNFVEKKSYVNRCRPIRLANPNMDNNNRIIVEGKDRVILNDIELKLFELCTGKLTHEEIINKYIALYGVEDKNSINRVFNTLLNKLDKNFLIVLAH